MAGMMNKVVVAKLDVTAQPIDTGNKMDNHAH